MQFRLLTLALLLGASATAGSLKTVREIPLSDYGLDQHRVTALAFSPDEQWVAAAVQDGRSARLLVVSRERRPDSLRYSGPLPPRSAFISWSPGGQALLIGSLLLDLNRETTCQLDPGISSSAFVSAKEIVASSRARLILYDPSCTPVHYRDLEAPVVSLATSPERGTIAVATSDNKLTLYEASSGRTLKTWRRPPRAQIGFLAAGEILCEASRPSRDRVTPECWSTSDDNTADPPSVQAGAPFSPAARAPLAAFTDGKYSYDDFFDTGSAGVRRGVIWNVLRGAMIASWKPEQESCGAIDDLWTDCRVPAVFALSPEGNYLVDVRKGQLRIQQVIP